jgi:hypothetical protein
VNGKDFIGGTMLSGVQGTGVKRDDPSIWSVAVTELARMRAGF